MTVQGPHTPPAVEPPKPAKGLSARLAAFRDWRKRWFPEEDTPVAPTFVDYLPDIDEIVAEPMPRRMRVTHYLVAALFLTLVIISAVAQVDIIVVGSGRLATSQPPIVLQPLDRGIIHDVKVRTGDVVRKGQILVTLDPTFAQADMEQFGQRHGALLAEIDRLEAEMAGRPYVPRNAADPEQALQANLYAQRQSQLASHLNQLDAEINQLSAALRTAEGNRQALTQRAALAREVERMRESLYKDEVGSKLHYLDSQNTRLQAEGDLESTINKMTELRHQLAGKQAERETFTNEWRRLILEQLVKDRQDVSQVSESLAKAIRMNDLVVVVAPRDGVVLDMAKRSVGSVVREAEPILTLIPLDSTMEADVEIASADVGYLKPGDEVQIKVDAFPYQKHGFLEGKLRDVSRDSYSARDDTSVGANSTQLRGGASAFHRGHIELTRTTLDRMPEGATLIPGMTVNAEIKVGSRSILSFFLWPILRGMNESLREP